MTSPIVLAASRRRFLQYLAGSPLFAPGAISAYAKEAPHGFRRGTDAVKALALGAQAVGLGRPYLWGLGAFGQEGVERVLEIVRNETRVAMQRAWSGSLKYLVGGPSAASCRSQSIDHRRLILDHS